MWTSEQPTCLTWLTRTCVMTHSYVSRDSLVGVSWLMHMCDMTHTYVCRDSFICVTWLIHMCDKTLHTCDMTHSYVWHDSFICVTWLIHMCDTTHPYVCKTRIKEHTYGWVVSLSLDEEQPTYVAPCECVLSRFVVRVQVIFLITLMRPCVLSRRTSGNKPFRVPIPFPYCCHTWHTGMHTHTHTPFRVDNPLLARYETHTHIHTPTYTHPHTLTYTHLLVSTTRFL